MMVYFVAKRSMVRLAKRFIAMNQKYFDVQKFSKLHMGWYFDFHSENQKLKILLNEIILVFIAISCQRTLQ